MTAASTQAAASQSATAKYNDLWEDFQSSHKDHAGDFRRVQYAANQVASSLAKQGMDVEKYMFMNRTRFMEDVAREMDSIFGKPEDKTQKPAEDPDPTRTGGMFGGIDSGSKPEASLAPDNAFSDIRKWQEETGFHR